MNVFQLTLTAAVLSCSLVAGFVFAFAVVVMPGIRALGDGQFLRTFQLLDGVIQDNQPLFVLVWVGSVVALVGSLVLGFAQVDGVSRAFLVAAAVIYLLGVQLPTAAINIPLNNAVQALDVKSLDENALAAARGSFEAPWNRWNSIRTVLAITTSLALIAVVLRL